MNTLDSRLRGLPAEKLQRLLAKLKKAPPQSAIERLPRESADFPQSFSQQRQWFLEQLMPGAVYNVPLAFSVEGELDLNLLGRCFQLMVERHEILRTVFRVVDGVPSQVILPTMAVELREFDVSALPEGERSARAREILEQQASAPFDIGVGPLWRHLSIRLGEQRHLLGITMHHIISDGWSAGVALRELIQLYTALRAGRPAELPPLRIQYADYAVWQQKQLKGPAIERQLQYWKKRLSGAPPLLRLPYDFERPSVQSTRGAVEEFMLSPELSADIQRLADRAGATPFMVMVSAFALVLGRYANSNDVCLGTAVANRTSPELETLIGLFINTLVLRCDLSDNCRFAALLERVRKTTIEAYDHQDVPFERVVEALNVDRNAKHSPVFQVLFVQTEDQLNSVSVPGLSLSPVVVHCGNAQFDLSLYLSVMAAGMHGSVEYSADLFRPETIRELIDALQQVLARIVQDPDRTIDDLVSPIPPRTLSVRVASTFTIEPVGDSLRYWLDELDLPATLEFAPYSQVFQSLLAEDGKLRTNSRGANLIFLRLEDWAQGGETEIAVELEGIERNAGEFLRCLRALAQNSHASFIVVVGSPSARVLDNPELKSRLWRLESQFVRELRGFSNIAVVTDRELQERSAVREVHAAINDELGHVPYTAEYFTAMGTAAIRALIGLADRAPDALDSKLAENADGSFT